MNQPACKAVTDNCQGNQSEYRDVVKPNARRMTGTTTTTMSSHGTESQSEDLSCMESPLSPGRDGLAMNLIKREMVQSLTRVAAARLRQSKDGKANMKDAEKAIRQLASMVLAGDENEEECQSPNSKIEGLKPDQNLRDLLRQALIVGDSDCYTTSEGETSSPASTTAVSGEDTEGNHTKATKYTQVDTKDAPLDIWHPDFWTTGEDSVNDMTNVSSSNHAASSTSPSRSSGAYTEGDDSNASQSLQEFLANLKEISSDSEQSDDEMSVLSDITGLTEAFPEDEERRILAKTKRAQVLLDSTPSTRMLATKRNRDGQNKVTFGEVCVRKYERILCDNPACTSGPSIGVGWRYKPQLPVSVDDFEAKRAPKRDSNDLMLDRATREKMVRRMGYSDKDIALMIRAVNKTKFQRRQTLNNLGVEKMEFAVEMAKRRLKSFLFLKGREVKTGY